MTLAAHFQMMAEYNRWMNRKLLVAAGKLDTGALFDDRGAFFRSIGGTLNHLMVGDTIWLARFASHPANYGSLETVKNLPASTALTSVLYETLSGLKRAREELDSIIINFVAEIDEADYDTVIGYENMAGESHSKQLSCLLQHFFNHQTHHRGQVTTLLSQAGIDPGTTDLLALIPDKERT